MTSYNPLVSIIINTHNNLEFLREAINSAYAQTYQNTEIILYDNASTQDIRTLCTEYDSKLRYYRSEKFLTLGQARNEALKVASGELIDYLDGDDIFHSNKLEKQVPLFINSEVGLVFCNTIFFKMIEGKKKEWPMFDKVPKEGAIFSDLLENYYLPFIGSIFRKSAIPKDPKDWFPEQFNICTDFELFLRISHSYKIHYVPELLCEWRIHNNNWSLTKSYLTPNEMLMCVPRILQYEPELFQKYKKSMRKFYSQIYTSQYQYYWEIGFTREAFLLSLHTFLLTFDWKHLVKAFCLPIISLKKFRSLTSKREVLA